MTILRYIARKHAPEYYPEAQRHIIDWCLDLKGMRIYQDASWKNLGWNYLAYPILGFRPEQPKEEMEARVKGSTENLDIYEKKLLADTKFIAMDTLNIADFAMAPLVKVMSHPLFQEKTGFILSERWVQWLKDFEAAVPCSGMMTSAQGWSLWEVLDSKA